MLRNTPLTVVFFAIAFGLPEVGINGSYYWFAIAALSLYTSAFVCEALRSGSQRGAGRAGGGGPGHRAAPSGRTCGWSSCPQAFRSSIPPLVSVLIAMIKNSAIAGFFGVAGDLSSVGDTLTSAQGYPAVPVLIGVLAGFWLLTLPIGALLAVVERRTAVAR